MNEPYSKYISNPISEDEFYEEIMEKTKTFYILLTSRYNMSSGRVHSIVFSRRNGVYGVPYAISDIFSLETGAFVGLLSWTFFNKIEGKSFQMPFYVGKYYKSELTLAYDDIAKIFPRGLPQNNKQMLKWLSYIGYLAKKDHAYEYIQ